MVSFFSNRPGWPTASNGSKGSKGWANGLLPSAQLAARSLLVQAERRGDDWLSSFFRWQSPAWPRRGADAVARVRRELAEAISLYDGQGWLESARAFHGEPSAPERVDLASNRLPGALHEDLSFWSGYAPHRHDPGGPRWRGYRANERAHAWVLRHADATRPWLVCVHGFGMGIPAIDLPVFDALAFHAAGLNVLGYVMPLHGVRARGTEGAGNLVTWSPLNMLHAQAQAVWDLRRILAWLREVGATRIGVHGISLGANAAALLASLEPELAALVVGVPSTDFAAAFRPAESDRDADATIPSAADPIWDQTKRALRVVSPLAMAAQLGREQLAVYAGLVDGLVSPASVSALLRHWGHPRCAWYPGGHVGFGFHSGPRELIRRTLREQGIDAGDYARS